MSWIENRFEEGLIVTSLDFAMNWARKNSLWPMTFGLACCAIEMMAVGRQPVRSGPLRRRRVPGHAAAIRPDDRGRHGQLQNGCASNGSIARCPIPKYVIAMGACTVGGGPYFKYGYNVVKGVDLVVPVDVYVPGCPPRPEALIEGIMRLQDKISATTLARSKAISPVAGLA